MSWCWRPGDRVEATFDPSGMGGPGEVIEVYPDEGSGLVQLDNGPAVVCGAWELADERIVPDGALDDLDALDDADGWHAWPYGMGSAP